MALCCGIPTNLTPKRRWASVQNHHHLEDTLPKLPGKQLSQSEDAVIEQAISAHEQALCQLTVCFDFLSKSERDGHIICACKWYSEVKYQVYC